MASYIYESFFYIDVCYQCKKNETIDDVKNYLALRKP